MSEAFAREAVLIYTMPGDLVVDPFSGSGTTQAVAFKTGRRFCGADLFYDNVRAERLDNLVPDTVSPLRGMRPAPAIWEAEARRIDIAPAQLAIRTVAACGSCCHGARSKSAL